jgi:hypothetical protein
VSGTTSKDKYAFAIESGSSTSATPNFVAIPLSKYASRPVLPTSLRVCQRIHN